MTTSMQRNWKGNSTTAAAVSVPSSTPSTSSRFSLKRKNHSFQLRKQQQQQTSQQQQQRASQQQQQQGRQCGMAVWDCMDQCGTTSMDLFGCDENIRAAGRHVFGPVGSGGGGAKHGGSNGMTATSSSLRLITPDDPPVSVAQLDFAAMHDEFLEALIYEQAVLQDKSSTTATPPLPSTFAEETPEHPSPAGSALWSNNSTFSISTTTDSSSGVDFLVEDDSAMMASATTATSATTPVAADAASHSGGSVSGGSCLSPSDPGSQQQQLQQHRPIRLHRRRSPARIRTEPVKRTKLHDASSSSNSHSGNTSNNVSLTISFADLSKASLPHPSAFLHPQCRMQKDKGKGEAVGSNICAKGMEACLEKLRTKMELLTTHALGDSAGTGKGKTAARATMNRRKAKVSERYENFVETRSLIELRMGFLSMQYGILLRWDTGRTGKITLVVLRKMCHESFYNTAVVAPVTTLPTIAPAAPSSTSAAVPMQEWTSHAPYVVDGGPQAVPADRGFFKHLDMSILEPPYLVPRPDVFQTGILMVRVLYATGLSRRSQWTIQMEYDGHIENFLMAYDSDQSCFLPKVNDPLKHVVGADLCPTLEVKLLESPAPRGSNIRRAKHRRESAVVATMNVPLYGLPAQPLHMVRPKPTRMRIPISLSALGNHRHHASSNDHDIVNDDVDDTQAAIQMELLLLSDFLDWAEQERMARQHEYEQEQEQQQLVNGRTSSFCRLIVLSHDNMNNNNHNNTIGGGTTILAMHDGNRDCHNNNNKINNHEAFDDGNDPDNPWEWICCSSLC